VDEAHETPPRSGTVESDVKYAREGKGRAVAVHVPPAHASARGWAPPPGGEYSPTAMHDTADGHDTADRDTSDPPGGTGSVAGAHVVPCSASAIGITPPPSDNEVGPTGTYEPTAMHDMADAHETAGDASKMPGGPATTAGRFAACQDDAAPAGAAATPPRTPVTRATTTGSRRMRIRTPDTLERETGRSPPFV
jgi:hypothetical protein